jgi:hypothetical protein
LQGGGGAFDGLLGLLPPFLLHGFADCGNGFGFVAGVDAGGVDLVFVPGTAGKPFGGGESAFAVDEQAVDFCD